MFDIKSMAAVATCEVVVIDPLTKAPMRGAGDRVCTITVNGPATTAFAEAEAAGRHGMRRRAKTKGEEPETPDEERMRVGRLLAMITVSFNGFTYKAMPNGFDAFFACYTDKRLRFLAERVGAEAGDWGNYMPSSRGRAASDDGPASGA